MKQMQYGLGLLLVAAGLLTTDASAVTYTWTGSGPDNNWSSVGNWDAAGLPASASNTTVRLAGNTRLKPVQDIASPFILNRLDYVPDIRHRSGTGGRPAALRAGRHHPAADLARPVGQLRPPQ